MPRSTKHRTASIGYATRLHRSHTGSTTIPKSHVAVRSCMLVHCMCEHTTRTGGMPDAVSILCTVARDFPLQHTASQMPFACLVTKEMQQVIPYQVPHYYVPQHEVSKHQALPDEELPQQQSLPRQELRPCRWVKDIHVEKRVGFYIKVRVFLPCKFSNPPLWCVTASILLRGVSFVLHVLKAFSEPRALPYKLSNLPL